MAFLRRAIPEGSGAAGRPVSNRAGCDARSLQHPETQRAEGKSHCGQLCSFCCGPVLVSLQVLSAELGEADAIVSCLSSQVQRLREVQ